MFKDRNDAGKRLAERLWQYKNSNAIVLALPRGGVVVGYEVACFLAAPLDIVVARKIGHPQNPEYAICATDEKGTLLCNEAEIKSVDRFWLKNEIERQRQEAARRIARYRGKRPPAELKGKKVLIVDDGIATGLTMQLSIKAVKSYMPDKIIVAVPVAPRDTARRLTREADEVIILESPENFMGAVGAYYEEFEQVDDDTVVRLLAT